MTLPKGIKKSQLNKRQAVLQNAVGPLRLKSKYYYKKQMVKGRGSYRQTSSSDLLLASLTFLRPGNSCFLRISSAASLFCSQGLHPEIFSLIGFSDPDLSGNRSMLMAKGKAVIYLGIVGTEPADLPLGRASADRTHGTYHSTVLHQTLL